MTEALGQFKQILVNIANDIGKIAAIRNSTQYSGVNYFGAFDQAVEVLSTLSSSDFKLPHVIEQSSNSNPFGTTNNIVSRSFGNEIYTFSFAGGNVVMIRSLDGGSTWSFSETQLNEPAGIQTVGFAYPLDIVKINGTVYFALTYEDLNLLTYNVCFITWGYSGNILHYGADIPSLDHVYAGYYDPVTDDYTYHIYGTDNKYYPEVYDGSASPTKGSEITGLVAPASFDINEQQYRIQGRYELQIDKDHFYFRILGASSWQQKIASGTSTLALGWGFDANGNLILYWIFWRDVIFKIFERGKIERIQDTSFDAFTGFGADIYEAWISTGDGILQFQPSQERLKNNNALAIDFRRHPIDYEGGKASIVDTSLGTIFEKDDYAIFFKDFLRYQLRNVQQFYLWDDNYKGTPHIPGVDDWGTSENPKITTSQGGVWNDLSVLPSIVSIDANIGNHSDVLKFNDLSNITQAKLQKTISQTSGFFELWIYTNDKTKRFDIDLQDGTFSDRLNLKIDNSYFQYNDGSDHNIVAIINNTWNHLKIIFDLASSWYVEINQQLYGPFGYAGTPVLFDILNLASLNGDTGYIVHVDSIITSWEGGHPGSPNLFREVYDYKGKPRIPGIIDWGNEIDDSISTWIEDMSVFKIISYSEKHRDSLFCEADTTLQRAVFPLTSTQTEGTYELWVKPTQNDKDIWIGGITNGSSPAARNNYICRVYLSGTGQIGFEGSTTSYNLLSYYPNFWYHIRVEYLKSGNCLLYVNNQWLATITGNAFDGIYFYNYVGTVTTTISFCLDSIAFVHDGYPPEFSANFFPLDTEQIHEAIVTNVGQPENGERTIKFETRTAQDLSRPVTLDILQQTVTAIAALLEAGNENAKILVSGASSALYDFPWKQQPLDECLTELANIDGLNWDILKTRDQNIILDDYQNLDPTAYDYKHWAGIEQWGDLSDWNDTGNIGSVVDSFDNHKDPVFLNNTTGGNLTFFKDITPAITGTIEFYYGGRLGGNCFLDIFQASGNVKAMRVILGANAIIYYAATSVSVPITGLAHFKFIFNCTTNKQTVYVNGNLILNDVDFYLSTNPISITTWFNQINAGASCYIDAIGYTPDGYKIGSNKNYNDQFANIDIDDNPQTASVIEVLGGLKPDGTRYSAIETITDVEGTTYSTTNPSFGQAECDAMAIALKTQKSVEVLQVRGTFGPNKPFQSGYRTLFSYPFDPVNINTQILAIIQKVVYEAVTGMNEFLFSDAIIRSSKGDSGITTRGNQQLINNLHSNTAIPTFSAYTDSAQSIPNASQTKVDYDSENFDYGSNYDSVTNYRFVAPEDGVYFFNARILFSSSTGWVDGDLCAINILRNGVNVRAGVRHNVEDAATMLLGAGVSGIIKLIKNQYVEIGVYQSSGGALTLLNDGVNNYFEGYLVRRT